MNRITVEFYEWLFVNILSYVYLLCADCQDGNAAVVWMLLLVGNADWV
jgi:hypothetical protein